CQTADRANNADSADESRLRNLLAKRRLKCTQHFGARPPRPFRHKRHACPTAAAMNLLYIVLPAALILLTAYFTYGWLLSRLFELNPQRKTPAYELQDGLDYEPL